MLNDMSRSTRLLVLGQTLPTGLILGATLAPLLLDQPVRLATTLSMIGVALVVVVAWAIVSLTWTARLHGSVGGRTEREGAALARGDVTGIPAPGLLVAARRTGRGLSHLVGSPGPVPGPTDLAVLVTLAPSGPRRVAALVPTALGLHRRAPVALLLHPHEPEVALVDPRADHGTLARIAADPRWRTERLPTNGSIAGGYGIVAGVGLLGLLVGLGLAVVAVAVL